MAMIEIPLYHKFLMRKAQQLSQARCPQTLALPGTHHQFILVWKMKWASLSHPDLVPPGTRHQPFLVSKTIWTYPSHLEEALLQFFLDRIMTWAPPSHQVLVPLGSHHQLILVWKAEWASPSHQGLVLLGTRHQPFQAFTRLSLQGLDPLGTHLQHFQACTKMPSLKDVVSIVAVSQAYVPCQTLQEMMLEVSSDQFSLPRRGDDNTWLICRIYPGSLIMQ